MLPLYVYTIYTHTYTGDDAAVAAPAKASSHVAGGSCSNLAPPTSENPAPAHVAQASRPWTVDLSQVREPGAVPDTRMRTGALFVFVPVVVYFMD